MILDLYFATPAVALGDPIYLALRCGHNSQKSKNRLFAVSRLLAFCLIIAAAANPYFVEVHTVSSQKPSITILDDRTGSMGIFDPDVAARVKNFVDAPLRTFSGDATPLGDRIVQYALPGSTLLLVTDGYSNSGRSLADALALARASNTTTFAISLAPERMTRAWRYPGRTPPSWPGIIPSRCWCVPREATRDRFLSLPTTN